MKGSRLWKIIRMEFRLTAANKAFIILTIIGPLLIAAVTLLPGVVSPNGGIAGGSELRVAIVNAAPGFVEGLQTAFARNRIRVFPVKGTSDVLDAQVRTGAFDGYLMLPDDLTAATRMRYVSKNVSDVRVISVLQGLIGQSVVALRLVGAGLPPQKIASLTQPPVIDTRQLGASGEKQNRDFLTVLMTGLTFAMLLYITVLIYGQAIGRSVLGEKTSKTVEIMLSSVLPLELLFGKIFGKAAASLLQYAVWVSMTTLFVKTLGPRLGVNIGFGGSPSTLAFLVLFFLLAFFLYCSLFAALGAACQDEQHLGQLAWPVIIFLMAPIVTISPIITSPNVPFIVGMSLFPLTAPVVMFLRILIGAAAAWEILASIGILVATTAGVIALSAKIFSVGLLMTGKRFRLGEILRWIRS